ncbi:rod shape-determining protein RodA [Lederbergia sp. NSJ-179]|uniref:FtsW/RodA/SpoVE family cell cycle protein n=1 Tax=Lederbergia sp. NSJ-179 TaxID=2931402 RepID=UPI001FD34E40|nr:FtsW/RodA/SpoVE family cell cycle protein [Lederbergia sp. NSJ-179]MCJ7840293.1 rod shape-determining protein RodA [Lederbergia sp. NSJ-179]
MTSSKKQIPKIDYGIILTLMLMALVSLITIYSAQKTGQYKVGDHNMNFVPKQIQWYVIGSVAAYIVMRLDSDQMKKISWYAYGLCAFSLLGLLAIDALGFSEKFFLAPERNGARSWYQIPGAGLIQPAEFMKIFLIITLAKVTSGHHVKFVQKTFKSDIWLLLKLGAITGVPALLILKQPDLGTALVFVAILLAVILVSGISWKILTPLFTISGLAGGALLYIAIYHHELLQGVLESHQYKRIYSWLDPYNFRTDEGYQLVNALESIGSGMTSGKGFYKGEVYMPESHSDFIFTTIGEEFGFIGASIVISLFFLLIYQITRTGLDTKNPFYSYICTGVVAMIAFHVFQNIGMTIGLMPITGIPLPFISYGGSGLLANMMVIGIVLSVRYHYKRFMFASDED